MNLICPNKSFFSNWLLNELNNKFNCNISNLNNKSFNKIANNYELVVLRAKSILKYKKNTKIKFIISPTTGLNHIDKKFFKNKKIKIISLEGESNFLNKVNATVEFTIYLILFFLRHKQLNQIKKKRISLLGNEINDRKIGIIGIGRIGKKIKKILKAFGAKVLTYEIKKDKSNSLNKLLKESDIISLHIPLKNNFNFLNQHKIKLLKPDSVIINTSRGEIIDEISLKKYIRSKNISYFTDVVSNEEIFFKNRLMKLKSNFFYTHHIGGLTEESVEITDKFIYQKFLKKYETR